MILNGYTVRPIAFKPEMVGAILDGRKSQTRRIVKPQPDHKENYIGYYGGTPVVGNIPGLEKCKYAEQADKILAKFKYCPYGQPGDVLWVREKWAKIDGRYEYATSYINHVRPTFRWKPSIHMPFEAARIFLQVQEIKVERLQSITEDDAIAEGVERLGFDQNEMPIYKDYTSDKLAGLFGAKNSFATLIISIHGCDTWYANPWVWVVKFKVLSTTGKPHFLTV